MDNSFKQYLNTPAIFVAITTCTLLLVAKYASGFQILLLDRFFQYGGYLQIIFAGILSIWLYNRLMNRDNYIALRRKMWVIFAILFFTQFIVGIFLSEMFLLTGKLHFPIPFMILSGAIYRGEINFMIILFLSAILLSGGAWCSHLCYFGGLDLLASSRTAKSKPLKISRKTQWTIRIAILTAFIAITILLSILDAPLWVIFSIILSIFAIELLIMVLFSRSKSKMIHCSCFCPIGTITALLKSINPRRVVINDRCTSCMSCTMYCKYSAIKPGEIKSKKMDLSCTGCGDCESICRSNAIEYKILNSNINKENAKRLNMAIITILYTIFVSVAMV